MSHEAGPRDTLAAFARHAAATLEAAGHEPDAAIRDVAVLSRAVLGWDQAAWIVAQRSNGLIPVLHVK